MSITMLRLGIKPGQWGWRFDELTAAWERIERLGFHVVSCFDHVTAEPRGNRAWDAPTLLAAMAGRTQRIALAVDVINVSLRHPFLHPCRVPGSSTGAPVPNGSCHYSTYEGLNDNCKD